MKSNFAWKTEKKITLAGARIRPEKCVYVKQDSPGGVEIGATLSKIRMTKSPTGGWVMCARGKRD